MDNKIMIFDMDDTLVDSHLRYTHGIFQVLDDEGIVYKPEEILPIMNPLGFPKTADFYATLGVTGTHDEIIRKMEDSMLKLYTTNVYLVPGVEAYLKRLKAEGVRLFVLTATPHRVADACLRMNGVYDIFEKVWCTDDFGHTKGEVALFQKVTEAIGCAPADILFYDDGVTAIRTAREAGWQTCGVMPSFAVESEGMELVAHRTIVGFEELL